MQKLIKIPKFHLSPVVVTLSHLSPIGINEHQDLLCFLVSSGINITWLPGKSNHDIASSDNIYSFVESPNNCFCFARNKVCIFPKMWSILPEACATATACFIYKKNISYYWYLNHCQKLRNFNRMNKSDLSKSHFYSSVFNTFHLLERK